MYSFEDEKLLREARKRDYLRSRLPAGKRWRAQDEADSLTQLTDKEQKKRQNETKRKDIDKGYDGAMETALSGINRDKSIRKIII